MGGSTNDKGRAKALALAKVSKSKNPSFILTVLPSYLNRRSPVVHNFFMLSLVLPSYKVPFTQVLLKTTNVLEHTFFCRILGSLLQRGT